MVPMPHLDHISLVAEQRALKELGFRVTPTSGSGEHARVFLDQTYFEVTPPGPRQSEVGSRAWFIRPADPAEAAGTLRAAGLAANGPSHYEGKDGSWLDVSISGDPASALPILTRRIDMPDGQWPPPLADPHPNGATRIAELHVQAQDPAPLLSLFEALGVPSVKRDAFELAGGTRIVVRASDGGSGVVTVVVERADAAELRLDLIAAAAFSITDTAGFVTAPAAGEQPQGATAAGKGHLAGARRTAGIPGAELA
jgi:Glyoxalase-like domain